MFMKMYLRLKNIQKLKRKRKVLQVRACNEEDIFLGYLSSINVEGDRFRLVLYFGACDGEYRWEVSILKYYEDVNICLPFGSGEGAFICIGLGNCSEEFIAERKNAHMEENRSRINYG